MKKLLLILLFTVPLINYSQNVQFDLKMFNNSTEAVVNTLPENAIQETDTLRLELHMSAVGTDDYTALADFKYLFLDIQYNHNIVAPIANAYSFPGVDALQDAGPYKQQYSYSNTSFGSLDYNLLNNYINWQAGTTVYSESNAKWSVVRIAIQLSDKSIQALLDPTSYTTVLPIYDMLFSVKPEASLDAEKEFRFTIATLEDINGDLPTSILASLNPPKYQFNIIEPVTYNATLHFNLPEALDPTNFVVAVGTSSSTTLIELPLDANGDAILTDVTLGEEYNVHNLIPVDPSYLPDVHTVSDAYRSFLYYTDIGINGNASTADNFGLFSADANLNQVFNSADVYGLLAYVLGLDVPIGEEGYCLPELVNDVWYHGCTAAVLYENYTVERLGAQLSGELDPETGEEYWNGRITPSEENLSFEFAFWHHVDLDQSHSTSFPATSTATSTAKTSMASSLNLSTKVVGTTTLDLVSKIESGLVKVELTHNGDDIVGLQARIKYDTSKLILKNIIYDTGNTVTNFSKPYNGELLFGGLSTDGGENIKKGKAFVLEFEPIGTVTNVTGLFYFENTDAVKENGDKLKLNIQ